MIHRRRPRAAFAICTPRLCAGSGQTTNPSSSSAASPSPVSSSIGANVEGRIAASRVRVQQLHARAGVRLGDMRAADAEETLRALLAETPVPEDANERAEALAVALEKDARMLDKIAHPGTLRAALKLREICERIAQDFPRETLHEAENEQFDGTQRDAPPVDDTVEWSDVNNVSMQSAQEVSVVEKSSIVDNVRRKVARQGNALKRKASSVRDGIGEKVTEFVKDDGSIDFKGLRNILQESIDKAGNVWERLNGRVPKDHASQSQQYSGEAVIESTVLAARDDTKQFRLREQIGELEKQLIEASRARENVLRKEDQLGKLIRAKEIRAMDDNVNAVRRTLAVRVLQLEMEKIFVSIAEEIESSSYDLMMDQRLMVTEFGELDERLAEMEVFVDSGEPVLVQDDTLGEVASDIQYLKTRLGLDSQLYSSATLSWPQVRQFVASSAMKTREGIEFYGRGIRLFIGDLRYAFRLIRRAVMGYTPTPREVRTLRRTGKDFLTLIPFTIILIAPLSPVGHVFVFSFLQRYWPDFFPSTFNERRQSLMKRYELYAKSISEGSDGMGDSTRGEREPSGDNGVTTLSKSGIFGKLPFFGTWLQQADAEIAKDAANRVNMARNDGEEYSCGETVASDPVPDDVNAPLGQARSADISAISPTSGSSLSSNGDPSSNPTSKQGTSNFVVDELHLAD